MDQVTESIILWESFLLESFLGKLSLPKAQDMLSRIESGLQSGDISKVQKAIDFLPQKSFPAIENAAKKIKGFPPLYSLAKKEAQRYAKTLELKAIAEPVALAVAAAASVKGGMKDVKENIKKTMQKGTMLEIIGVLLIIASIITRGVAIYMRSETTIFATLFVVGIIGMVMGIIINRIGSKKKQFPGYALGYSH